MLSSRMPFLLAGKKEYERLIKEFPARSNMGTTDLTLSPPTPFLKFNLINIAVCDYFMGRMIYVY